LSVTAANRPAVAPPGDSTPERFKPPSWRNARFLVGAALLLVSALIGAVLLSTPDKHPMWTAKHDLPAGALIRSSDVVAVAVSVPAGYIPASTSIVGKRVRRPIGAGELVPVDALGSAVVGDLRSIAVPIEDQHSPPTLAAGSYVDVWVTPRNVAGGLGVPFLALAAVPVASVTRDSMGGATAAGTVVLEVKPPQARDLISGLRRGVIDLVRVPGLSP
jgi:Flp pilus assembly protein CpaB